MSSFKQPDGWLRCAVITSNGISAVCQNFDSYRVAIIGRTFTDNTVLVLSHSTQDLFSDPTADSAAELLLERDTHLFLKIQLDADNGKINVNEAALDIAGDDNAAPITVAGIKAEVSLIYLVLKGGISFARRRGRPFLRNLADRFACCYVDLPNSRQPRQHCSRHECRRSPRTR